MSVRSCASQHQLLSSYYQLCLSHSNAALVMSYELSFTFYAHFCCHCSRDSRARGDGRLLLTASRSLIKRKACRAGFFVNPRNLEASLAELCKLYSLKPAASELLTRCVKCNGRILTVDESHRIELRQRSDVPAALVAHGATIELFCCNGCQQVSVVIFMTYYM
jgi:uncharacterized protein with PIN domain